MFFSKEIVFVSQQHKSKGVFSDVSRPGFSDLSFFIFHRVLALNSYFLVSLNDSLISPNLGGFPLITQKQ